MLNNMPGGYSHVPSDEVRDTINDWRKEVPNCDQWLIDRMMRYLVDLLEFRNARCSCKVENPPTNSVTLALKGE